MNIVEFKKIIDDVNIDVPNGDCYLAFAKSDKEISISFEGNKDLLVDCFVRLMKKYNDLADVVISAADAYEMEKE